MNSGTKDIKKPFSVVKIVFRRKRLGISKPNPALEKCEATWVCGAGVRYLSSMGGMRRLWAAGPFFGLLSESWIT